MLEHMQKCSGDPLRFAAPVWSTVTQTVKDTPQREGGFQFFVDDISSPMSGYEVMNVIQ